MIAELDPVIILQLGTDAAIHTCIGHYASPPHLSVPTLQQGMNMFNIYYNFVIVA